MNEDLQKKLEAAIVACAAKAVDATSSIEALQYTQAALNAANALVSLSEEFRQ